MITYKIKNIIIRPKLQILHLLIYGLIALVIFPQNANSQNVPKNADELIEFMQTTYKVLTNFTADFIEINKYEGFDEIDSTSGKIAMLKPDYFLLETRVRRFMTDGLSIWDYNLVENRVTIDTYEDTNESFIYKELLFEITDKYVTEDFRPEKRRGKKGYVIDFVPKKPDEETIQYMEVWIEEGIWVVQEIKTTDIDETNLHFILNNFKLDTDFTKETFLSKLPNEKVKTTDLRKKGQNIPQENN